MTVSPSSRRSCLEAFTLIELLVVMAVIALGLGMAGQALRENDATTALESGQALVGGLLAAARIQAELTGRDAALLVNNTAANEDNPSRYLRYCVVVVRDVGNSKWEPVDEGVYLPANIAFLSNATPSGDLTVAGSNWARTSGGTLRSTVFSTGQVIQAINSKTSETWLGVGFSPRGTVGAQGLGGSGDLVLATVRVQPPGSSFPLQFDHPDDVRGFSLSAYGIPVPIDDRAGF